MFAIIGESPRKRDSYDGWHHRLQRFSYSSNSLSVHHSESPPSCLRAYSISSQSKQYSASLSSKSPSLQLYLVSSLWHFRHIMVRSSLTGISDGSLDEGTDGVLPMMNIDLVAAFLPTTSRKFSVGAVLVTDFDGMICCVE